jgi:pilus assembly protein CpaC
MTRELLASMAAIASGLILSVAANGADTGAATVAPASAPISAAAPSGPGEMNQIPAKGPAIVVEAGKGTLIRLLRGAATVFIANPDIADVQVKSPSLIYLIAKTPGETALYAVDSQDHVLLNAPVRVEHDLSRVRQTMSAIAPGENVKVSSVDNSLVLSGDVSSAGRAEKLRSMAASIAKETKGSVVNRLAVATPNQVNIRVKVAEVDRQLLKSIGVNWVKLAGNVQFATTNPFVGGNITTQNLLRALVGGGNGQSQVFVDALAQEGFITTLAEPNLTATNGQPASFLAGGEFPVPVAAATAASGGVPTITVEFKKFGVSLDVTPTIIDAEHLSMRVRTEVSQLSNNGAVSLPVSSTQTITIPALTERSAETTVELGSGQGFLLGGLLENETISTVSKVPGIGDLPILGQLFRSEQFEKRETELVIAVTPYLVKPTLTSLAMPTDGYVSPHDAQRVINADTYRQGLPAPARGPVGAGGAGLVGPVGFRLD